MTAVEFLYLWSIAVMFSLIMMTVLYSDGDEYIYLWSDIHKSFDTVPLSEDIFSMTHAVGMSHMRSSDLFILTPLEEILT